MEKVRYKSILMAIRKEIFGGLPLHKAAVEMRKLSEKDIEDLRKSFKEEGIEIDEN